MLTFKHLSKCMVRGGVADALESKLGNDALEALEYLVNRYFVKPKNNTLPPKDIIMQVIAEVVDDVNLF